MMEFETELHPYQDQLSKSGIASTELISTVMSEGRSVTNQIKTRSVAGIGFSVGTTPSRSLAGTRCMDRWDEGSWDTIPLDTEGSSS